MILDAGPLIAVDRNRRRLAAVMAAALELNETLTTTDAVVAQTWRSPRQANLAAALNSIEVESRFGDGRAIGELLSQAGTSDVVDAHLVILARRSNQAILTSDIDDLERLAEVAGVRLADFSSAR